MQECHTDYVRAFGWAVETSVLNTCKAINSFWGFSFQVVSNLAMVAMMMLRAASSHGVLEATEDEVGQAHCIRSDYRLIYVQINIPIVYADDFNALSEHKLIKAFLRLFCHSIWPAEQFIYFPCLKYSDDWIGLGFLLLASKCSLVYCEYFIFSISKT